MVEIVSRERVLDSLSNVYDPDLKEDLVTLNMIRDLEIIENRVNFTIMLTTPACPMKDKMKNDAYVAVKAIPGVDSVKIKLDAEVPGDGRSRGCRG